MAAVETGRKRISFHRISRKKNQGDSHGVTVFKKVHFAVYTTDGRRFKVPLLYHASGVVREHFALAEEELGIPGEGPIVLPIDASSMEHMMSMNRRCLGSAQEKSLLVI